MKLLIEKDSDIVLIGIHPSKNLKGKQIICLDN